MSGDIFIGGYIMDIWLFLIKDNVLLHIEEGTGDNLLKEDRQEGYVDYVNYYVYDMTDPPEEINGGMIMYKELVSSKEDTDIITDVINDLEFHHSYTRFA